MSSGARTADDALFRDPALLKILSQGSDPECIQDDSANQIPLHAFQICQGICDC